MLVVTESAVFRLDHTGTGPPTVVFEGAGIDCAATAGARTWIGHSNGEVVAVGSDGVSLTQAHVPEPVSCLLCADAEGITALVGTDDGAHLFRVGADGTVERLSAFDALPCRKGWHTPWGGPPAVRSLARTGDGWVYADVHVGSIMRSPDGGASWEPVHPELHEDVHQVATCPSDDERVYANTANAVYISEDRGASWPRRAEGLAARYGRAVAVDPEDPGLLLATVSDGPHAGHGRLYRSEDCGRTWTHAVDGFPATTDGNIDTGHIAFSNSGEAWAAVGDALYVGGSRATPWRAHWHAPRAIRQLVG